MYFWLSCVLFNVLIIEITGSAKGEFTGCYRKAQTHEIQIRTQENCFEFCEERFYRYSVLGENFCGCANKLKESEEDKSLCNNNCTGIPQLSCGGSDTESYYETGNSKAGAVRNLRIQAIGDDKITLNWETPDNNGIMITNYEVTAITLKTYSSTPWTLQNHTWTVQKESTKFDLSNLHPSTTYNITITPKVGSDIGGVVNIESTTILGIPDQPEPPKVLEESDGRIKIELKQSTNNNGPISAYRIVVHFVDNELLIHDFDESLVESYKKSLEDGLSYYIAAEINLQEDTKQFTIGDNQVYGGYLNPPLPKNRHVHVLLGVVSRLNNMEKVRYSVVSHDEAHAEIVTNIVQEIEETGSDVLIVVLTFACIICGLILLGSIVFYGYIRVKLGPRMNRMERHEMSLQGPILEVDNNGFISDNAGVNFKEQLQQVLYGLDNDQKITRRNLSLDIDSIIGMGHFGDVIQGTLSGNETLPCQVHVVSPDDMERPAQLQFLRELNNLLQFGFHKNMLNFQGICQTSDWFFVVFEEAPITLKKFLLNARREVNLNNPRLTNLSEEHILKLIYDLAETMEYLSFNKIVHKNLNSYNVKVVRQNGIYGLKLSIFGPTLYYNVDDENKNKQIDDERWFSPEMIKFQKFSHASDVWSFALVSWECCCLGATVYGSIPTSDLLTRIKKGLRPEQHPFIYDDLYQMFINCWEMDAFERPSFNDIVIQLKQLQSSPNYALNYSVDAQLPYFMPLLELKN